jgi:hypothetical protein
VCETYCVVFLVVASTATKRALGSMQKKIMLCFYRPSGQDVWLNRAVALLGRHPYCHVEMRFDDGYATSIFAGEDVFYRKRSYSNPNYTLLTILVNDKQERDLKKTAQEAANGGVSFDSCGMYAAAWPCVSAVYGAFCGCDWSSESTGTTYASIMRPTFCSKYITSLLQNVEIPEVARLNARSTTPSMLYDSMRGTPMICWDTVPFKMSFLSEHI